MSDYIDFLKEDFEDADYNKKKQEFLEKYNGRQGEIRFYNNPDIDGNLIPNREKGLYVIEFWQVFNDKGEIVDAEERKKREEEEFITHRKIKLKDTSLLARKFIASDEAVLVINAVDIEQIMENKGIVKSFIKKSSKKNPILGYFCIKDENINLLSSYLITLGDNETIIWYDEEEQELVLHKEQIKYIISNIQSARAGIWKQQTIYYEEVNKCKTIKELEDIDIKYEI